ncbi:histidine kinase dimerization/phosphoacceptor domain -containing protein [Ekhidna sp.]|uniref:sensor histidine kinase n=1 Tax=Ekhidna sp. TaxID=2608089 RepID=UPI003C7EB718
MHQQSIIVFFIVALLSFYNTNGQKADSLISLIEETSSDRVKLSVYNELLGDLYNERNDSLLYYAEQYLELAQSENQPMHQIYALEYQALYYDVYKSDYSRSFQLYELALKRCDEYNIDYRQDLYHGIAILFHISDDYEKALNYYNLALEDASEDDSFRKKILTNMASIQSSLGNYEEAEQLFLTAIEIEDETFEMINSLYSNFGNLYLRKGEPEKAIPYLKEALRIGFEKEHKSGLFYDISFLMDAKIAMQDKEGLDTLIQYVDQHGDAILNLREKTIIFRSVFEALQLLGDYKKASTYQDKYIRGYEDLIGQQRSDLIYEMEAKYDNEKKKKEIAELEVEQQRAQNERNAWFMISGLVVSIAIFLFILLRTKSKSNAMISKSLAEKETLLREIHHRVKNNLQVVSSLLSMQSRFIEDKKALGAVNEGQHRVASMALIHQKLYQDNNLSGVNAQDYIADLTDTLVEAYGINDRVNVIYEVDRLNVDVDTIIPMGLILNELISNSFKHAFPNDREGELRVYLKEESEKLTLKVSDDGVGQGEVEGKNTFGSILIQSLAQKLQATLQTQNERGFMTQLTISKYKLVS